MTELKKRIQAAILDIQRDEMYFASDNRTFDFIRLNPGNTDEVLVNEKISAMNNGIIDVHFVPAMATHIMALEVDHSLQKKDVGIVEKISALDKQDPYKFRKFASRYCSYHDPSAYAIQTDVAEELMSLFVKDPDTSTDLPENILPYQNFKTVTDAFMTEYKFHAFNYYEMEKCIWLKSVPLLQYFNDLSIRKNLE